MKIKLNTRILSALLAFVLFMNCCPMLSFAELFPEGFRIVFEGEKISEITFFEHEKKIITAENLPENCAYQWQIQIPNTDVWVDIQGQTNQELGISYALVGSLLDEEQSAYVRCAAVLDGTDAEYTNPLRATVMEEPEVLILDESADTESMPEYTEFVPDVTEENLPEATEETVATEATEETVPEATEETAATEATEETVSEATEETAATEATEETISEATEAVEEIVVPEAAEETSAPTEEETVPEVMEEISAPMMFALPRNTSEQVPADDGDIMLLADGDPSPTEFVTVKIQYMRYDYIKNPDGNLVLTDNGQAFNPYVATLLKGSSLKTEVTFPTMVGYDMYFGDSETASTKLEINLTDIQDDVVYVVKYKPAQVDYTVRYYFQNVYDDNYVENTDLAPTQSTKGATGSNPDPDLVEAQFPGFTPLFYEPETIAADGSTEFEVYYERNYYLMEFDCNEGYGTDTLYVRYGTYISVPQPVRTGYVFKGWDLVKSENPDTPVTSGDGNVDMLPLEMPRYNSGYKAKWDTIQTTYSIIYWAENADDGYYSYWGTAAGNAESATHIVPIDVAMQPAYSAEKQGLDNAEYFTLNEVKTTAGNPATVLIEGDGSSAINVYYSRKTYTIEFKHTGNCQMEHTHTESCYQYFCDIRHQHSEECYVCGLNEHAHSEACCSLYHVHGDKCAAGNCNHTTHGISCYSFTGGTVSNTASNVNPDYYTNRGDVQVHRQSSGWGYNYYAYIDGKFYQISNYGYNINNFSGALNCSHIHEAGCYTCSIPVHTHGSDEQCNLEDCPADGREHTHSETCYVCGRTEQAHEQACCNLEVHSHDSCPAANCFHTTHGITCYTTNSTVREAQDSDNDYGFSNVINYAGSSPQELRIYRYGSGRYSYNRTYYNYIYLNGAWYYLGTGNGNVAGLQWSGSDPGNGSVTVSSTEVSVTACTHEHSAPCYSCGKTAHAHGDGMCNADGCENPAHHIHSGACYLCNISHVHDNSCNNALVCMLPEHTHTTGCTNSTTKTIYKITAKYDADISQVWEQGPIRLLLDEGYVWESSVTGKYYSFLERMPSYNITMTATKWSGIKHEWYYYLEVGVDEDRTGLTLRTDGGVTYKLYHTTTIYAGSDTSLTKDEDYFPIKGYTQRDNDVPSFQTVDNVKYAYLYYRIKDNLEFKYYNHSEEGPNPNTQLLQYNQSLSGLDISKEVMERDYYPNGLEPGAYTFDGWYTSKGCYPGSEVKWNELTMPDGDLEIYAKWVPVTHNVYFYSLYTNIGTTNYWYPVDTDGTEIHINYPIIVEHGALLGTTYNYTPDRDGYTFIGWFYMDEDNKKRFAPDSMEIKKDLHLFAEWQSGIDTEYKVTYVLGEDITGTEYTAGTEVAPPTEGHSTAGKTKTFTAKGMGELYTQFQANMFPEVSSHSILMDEDKTKNNYTFTYVYDENVYYQIRYIDYVNGTELHAPVMKNTGNAIVTEKFLPISGYVPMNFYIRKALVSDDDNTSTDAVLPDNIITFYYTQDNQHGLYSIEYYQETDVADKYAQYESIVGSANLEDSPGHDNIIKEGDEFNIRSYNGFTYYGYKVITYAEDGTPSIPDTIQTTGTPQGTLTHAGLTIQLYYKRNPYPYIIEYREHGTEKLLQTVSNDSDDYKKKFGTEVSHTAVQTLTVDSTLYTYHLADSTEEDRTKTITIRSFETGKENPNKLIFYYVPKTVDVLYKAAYRNTALTDLCFVSMASEQATTASGLLGSSALPGKGFRFVGWYSDEACTTKVNDSWVSTKDGYQHLIPGELNTAQDEVSYYALFEPIDLNVTYNANGGNPVASQTSHIGETITLPTATRTGYTLVNWWYDADKDTVIDEGETYAAGASFVMPGEDVNFIAQWIDERLDNTHKVYIGVNLPYHMPGKTYYYPDLGITQDAYHTFPDEPLEIYFDSLRAYFKEGKWHVDMNYDNPLTTNSAEYIDERIFEDENFQTNYKNTGSVGLRDPDVYNNINTNGDLIKKYFSLSDDAYNGIIQAWIDSKANGAVGTDIPWDRNLTVDDFKVVPYVIKYHDGNWFVDMVILAKVKYILSYDLNMAEGYSGTPEIPSQWHGENYKTNAATPGSISKEVTGITSTAKFLYWEGSDGKQYQADDMIVMTQDLKLTAVWDYPLIISQTGIADTAIYEVVDDGGDVVLTVALTGHEQVAIYQLPAGDYTVRELTGWTWKYDSEGSKSIQVTGTEEKIVKFTYTGTTPDWLHGETHKENNFAPVPNP